MSPWFTCDPGVAALSPGPQLLQRLQFCLSQAPFASSAEAQGLLSQLQQCQKQNSCASDGAAQCKTTAAQGEANDARPTSRHAQHAGHTSGLASAEAPAPAYHPDAEPQPSQQDLPPAPDRPLSQEHPATFPTHHTSQLQAPSAPSPAPDARNEGGVPTAELGGMGELAGQPSPVVASFDAHTATLPSLQEGFAVPDGSQRCNPSDEPATGQTSPEPRYTFSQDDRPDAMQSVALAGDDQAAEPALTPSLFPTTGHATSRGAQQAQADTSTVATSPRPATDAAVSPQPQPTVEGQVASLHLTMPPTLQPPSAPEQLATATPSLAQMPASTNQVDSLGAMMTGDTPFGAQLSAQLEQQRGLGQSAGPLGSGAPADVAEAPDTVAGYPPAVGSAQGPAPLPAAPAAAPQPAEQPAVQPTSSLLPLRAAPVPPPQWPQSAQRPEGAAAEAAQEWAQVRAAAPQVVRAASPAFTTGAAASRTDGPSTDGPSMFGPASASMGGVGKFRGLRPVSGLPPSGSPVLAQAFRAPKRAPSQGSRLAAAAGASTSQDTASRPGLDSQPGSLSSLSRARRLSQLGSADMAVSADADSATAGSAPTNGPSKAPKRIKIGAPIVKRSAEDLKRLQALLSDDFDGIGDGDAPAGSSAFATAGSSMARSMPTFRNASSALAATPGEFADPPERSPYQQQPQLGQPSLYAHPGQPQASHQQPCALAHMPPPSYHTHAHPHPPPLSFHSYGAHPPPPPPYQAPQQAPGGPLPPLHVGFTPQGPGYPGPSLGSARPPYGSEAGQGAAPGRPQQGAWGPPAGFGSLYDESAQWPSGMGPGGGGTGPTMGTHPAGSMGPVASMGPMGSTGPVCSMGPMGASMPMGSHGPMGNTSLMGGSGPVGSMGPMGGPGPAHIAGLAGHMADGGQSEGPVSQDDDEALWQMVAQVSRDRAVASRGAGATSQWQGQGPAGPGTYSLQAPPSSSVPSMQAPPVSHGQQGMGPSLLPPISHGHQGASMPSLQLPPSFGQQGGSVPPQQVPSAEHQGGLGPSPEMPASTLSPGGGTWQGPSFGALGAGPLQQQVHPVGAGPGPAVQVAGAGTAAVAQGPPASLLLPPAAPPPPDPSPPASPACTDPSVQLAAVPPTAGHSSHGMTLIEPTVGPAGSLHGKQRSVSPSPVPPQVVLSHGQRADAVPKSAPAPPLPPSPPSIPANPNPNTPPADEPGNAGSGFEHGASNAEASVPGPPVLPLSSKPRSVALASGAPRASLSLFGLTTGRGQAMQPSDAALSSVASRFGAPLPAQPHQHAPAGDVSTAPHAPTNPAPQHAASAVCEADVGGASMGLSMGATRDGAGGAKALPGLTFGSGRTAVISAAGRNRVAAMFGSAMSTAFTVAHDKDPDTAMQTAAAASDAPSVSPKHEGAVTGVAPRQVVFAPNNRKRPSPPPTGVQQQAVGADQPGQAGDVGSKPGQAAGALVRPMPKRHAFVRPELLRPRAPPAAAGAAGAKANVQKRAYLALAAPSGAAADHGNTADAACDAEVLYSATSVPSAADITADNALAVRFYSSMPAFEAGNTNTAMDTATGTMPVDAVLDGQLVAAARGDGGAAGADGLGPGVQQGGESVWGPEQARAALLAEGACDKDVSQSWVDNHYRWVVWTLAKHQASHQEDCYPHMKLTPANILNKLRRRYNREVVDGDHSPLSSIMRGEVPTASPLVLMVSSLHPTPPTTAPVTHTADTTAPSEGPGGATGRAPGSGAAEHIGDTIECTDGWYPVRVCLDGPLTALVRQGVMKVGSRLRLSYIKTGEEAHPLTAHAAGATLRTWFNACWSVPDASTKLGPAPRSVALRPLNYVHTEGQSVPQMLVLVQAQYAIQWYDPNNKGPFRTQRAMQERLKSQCKLQGYDSDQQEDGYTAVPSNRQQSRVVPTQYVRVSAVVPGGLQPKGADVWTQALVRVWRMVDEETGEGSLEEGCVYLVTDLCPGGTRSSTGNRNAFHTMGNCPVVELNTTRDKTRWIKIDTAAALCKPGLAPQYHMDWSGARPTLYLSDLDRLAELRASAYQEQDAAVRAGHAAADAAAAAQGPDAASFWHCPGVARCLLQPVCWPAEFDYTGIVVAAGPPKAERHVSVQWVFLIDESCQYVQTAQQALPGPEGLGGDAQQGSNARPWMLAVKVVGAPESVDFVDMPALFTASPKAADNVSVLSFKHLHLLDRDDNNRCWRAGAGFWSAQARPGRASQAVTRLARWAEQNMEMLSKLQQECLALLPARD